MSRESALRHGLYFLKGILRSTANGAFPIIRKLRKGHLLGLLFIAEATHLAHPCIHEVIFHVLNIVHGPRLVKLRPDPARSWIYE
jgi:hypothetical protein